MKKTQTFAMIKPDAVKNKHIGNIINKIETSGFEICNLKLFRFDKAKASQFYDVHKDRPFFIDLIDFITSGYVILLHLEKTNAVSDFRILIGATNPDEAKEGTIRKLYARSISENAIHGSDSDENANVEIKLMFP